MKKMFFIAVGMGIALFVYGYIFSTVGHDHSSHSTNAPMESVQAHTDHSHH